MFVTPIPCVTPECTPGAREKWDIPPNTPIPGLGVPGVGFTVDGVTVTPVTKYSFVDDSLVL